MEVTICKSNFDISYGQYDVKRAEIAKFAKKNGVRGAAKKFEMPRSTVQSMMKSLHKVAKDGEVRILPKLKRGRSTMLPKELDDKVIKMAKNLRATGVSINYNILVGIARGIVIANDRFILRENGGTVELQETWAQSIYRRMNMVRRRGTTSKQHGWVYIQTSSSNYCSAVQHLR